MKYRLALVVSAAILAGCGRGEVSSDTSDETGVGYYIDSAVSGVNYSCGTQSGLTDSDGMFRFDVGQGCTFSINDAVLHEVMSSELSNGVQIQEQNLTVARLLQSLDNDGDAENGIQITEEIRQILADNNITTVPETDNALSNIVQKMNEGSSSYAGSVKTTEETMVHLAGFKIQINASKLSVTEGESVILTTGINGDESMIESYAWSKGEDVLGTQAQVVLDDLSAGIHIITLTVVSANGYTFTKTITITVSAAASNNVDFSEKSLTEGDHGVMVDSYTQKMWVSETSENNNGGCLAMHDAADYETGKTFCENLTYAGFTDWRMPYSSEMSDFVTRTINEGVLPGYLAPCQILLAQDDADGSYVAVVTRYGDNDTRDAGDVQAVEYPIGLRCVRDMDGTPVADAGADISVAYNAEFTFDASRSFDLDGNIVKYEWLYMGQYLTTDETIMAGPIYTRIANSAGDHNVTLRVTDNEGNTDEDIVRVYVY